MPKKNSICHFFVAATIFLCSASTPLSAQVEEYGSPGEAVDLGLSVMWGDRNVGASAPNAVGKYFGYGDISGKITATTYDKYISQDILATDHDPAYVFWGAGWRMPSAYELDELCERCKWQWTKEDTVVGFRVTGRGGNSIFLPVTGLRSDTAFFYKETRGYYWGGEVNHINANYAAAIFFYKDRHFVKDYRKIYGFVIRPVRESSF